MTITQKDWKNATEILLDSDFKLDHLIGSQSNVPYGPFHMQFSNRFEEMKESWLESTHESRLHLLRVVTSRLNKDEYAANEFRKRLGIDHFYVATCDGWKGLFEELNAPYILYMRLGCDPKIVSSKGITLRDPNINSHWTKSGPIEDKSQFFKKHCRSYTDSRHTSDNGSVISNNEEQSMKFSSDKEEIILDFIQKTSRAEIYSAMSSIYRMDLSEVIHVPSKIDEAIKHLTTLRDMVMEEFTVDNEEPESDNDSN